MKPIGPEALLIASAFGQDGGLEQYRRLEYPSETAASIARSGRSHVELRPGGSSLREFVGRVRALARVFRSPGSLRTPETDAPGARGEKDLLAGALPVRSFSGVAAGEAFPAISLVAMGARTDARGSEVFAQRPARETIEFRALVEAGTASEPCSS